MVDDSVNKQGLSLVNNSQNAIVGVHNEKGCVNVKAVHKVDNEGLKTIVFRANQQTKELLATNGNTSACAYFADYTESKKLMLVGELDLLREEMNERKELVDKLMQSSNQDMECGDDSFFVFKPKKGSINSDSKDIIFDI